MQWRDIIMDERTYQPYILVGPPVWRPVLDPLAAYTSTIVYLCYSSATVELISNNKLLNNWT